MLLGLLLLGAAASQPGLAAAPELAPLQELLAQGGQVSALVVQLRERAILARLNPDQRLIPASLTKRVLAAAALERWGAEHTFQIRLWMLGKRTGAVLDGDLVVEGAGDPSLTNEKLWFLCTDVARMGIQEVQGDLVLNTSRFGMLEPPDQDRAAAATFSQHADDGPLSTVAANFSVLAAVVGPGDAAGQPGRVVWNPMA